MLLCRRLDFMEHRIAISYSDSLWFSLFYFMFASPPMSLNIISYKKKKELKYNFNPLISNHTIILLFCYKSLICSNKFLLFFLLSHLVIKVEHICTLYTS
ncbi:hypothetical protein ACB092_01G041600 [Castanea dentata]